VEQTFTPPTAHDQEFWADAESWVLVSWQRNAEQTDASEGFREIAARCGDAVETLATRFPLRS
jgi:hypothetical protein